MRTPLLLIALLLFGAPALAQAPRVGEVIHDAEGEVIGYTHDASAYPPRPMSREEKTFLIWIWGRRDRGSDTSRAEIEALRQQLALTQQQIAQLLALSQRPQQAPSQPQIILLNPYQQLQPEPQPRQRLDPEPQPRQRLEPEPRPRQQLDPEPRPRQQIDPEPRPRQDLRPEGTRPRQDLTPIPGEIKPDDRGIGKPAGYQRYTKARGIVRAIHEGGR